MPNKKIIKRRKKEKTKLKILKTKTGGKWCNPSKLEPYRNLIEELLKKDWPLENIREMLEKKFETKTALSTLHNFIRVRLIYS
jgi:hypothetical protein